MKYSQFNIKVNTSDNNTIIYNTRTTKFVKISERKDLDKIENFIKNKYFDGESSVLLRLYEQKFIIDDNVDEYEECKKEIMEYYNKLEKTLYLTLFVTEDCIFRCPYCYEEHTKAKFSKTMWNTIFKYVQNSISKGIYNSVEISFFGGEPLIEFKNIDFFLQKMRDLKTIYPHVTYRFNITTNGYLLTPDIYDKLISYGVKNFQITLGTSKEEHDSQRYLVNGNGTWNKIISNLEHINKKNDDTKILIRVNVDNNTINSIGNFNEYFYSKFDKSKFLVSVQPIISFTEKVPKEAAFSLDAPSDIKSTFIDAVIQEGANRFPIKKFQICKSSIKTFFAIHPNGNIVKCQKDSNARDLIVIGKLSKDGEIILNQDYQLFVNDMEFEDCQTCSIYPICCARTCPLQKVNSIKNNCDRYDCKKMKKFYKDYILPFIRDKLVKVNHIRKI